MSDWYPVIWPSSENMLLRRYIKVIIGIAIITTALVLCIVFRILQKKHQRRLVRIKKFLKQQKKHQQQYNLNEVLQSDGNQFFEKLVAYCEYFVHTGKYLSLDDLRDDLDFPVTVKKHIADVVYHNTTPSTKIIQEIKDTLH